MQANSRVAEASRAIWRMDVGLDMPFFITIVRFVYQKSTPQPVANTWVVCSIWAEAKLSCKHEEHGPPENPLHRTLLRGLKQDSVS